MSSKQSKLIHLQSGLGDKADRYMDLRGEKTQHSCNLAWSSSNDLRPSFLITPKLGHAYWIIHHRTPTQESLNAAYISFHRALELGFEADDVFWDRLGHTHQERGELDLAEKAFRKAYEKDKSYAYCLGVCLITQGKYEEALPLVLRDAESIHRDTRSWFQVALCHANSGRPGQAEEAYIRAIHLDPDYAHAWYNLGGLYWNEGNLRKATRIWKRALQKFPDFDRAEEVRDVLLKLGL